VCKIISCNITLRSAQFVSELYWIQVILANNRNEGSVRDPREDTKMLRLFIVVPKSNTEQDIENEFSVCILFHY